MRLYFIFIVLLTNTICIGQYGSLKSNFGNDGKLMLDIDDLDELVGVCKDDQGNTIFYGNTSQNLGGIYPFDFFIGKMDEYGNLDESFGDSGIFRSDFPGYEISSIKKAVLDSSGIYFIGGGVNPGLPDTNSIFVGCITRDGQINETFGENGYYTSSFLGAYNTPGSIILDSESKVVFCGSTTDDSVTFAEYSLVGRLLKDGTPDSTFGNTGIVVWDYYAGALVDGMGPVTVDPNPTRHGEGAYLSQILEVNNSYFVCGRFVNTSFAIIQMMNFSKDGSLNPDFVVAGPHIFQIEPGFNHTIRDVTSFNDKIYLCVETDGFSLGGKFLIQEVDGTGVLGEVTEFGYENHVLRSNAMDVYDNKLYIGGYSRLNTNNSAGYFSDDFMIYAVDTELVVTNGFADSIYFEQNMATEDELGMNDFIFHSQYAIMGGYMNNVHDDNYTDLAFMAVDFDPTHVSKEPITEFKVYPNPSNNYLKIDSPEEILELKVYDMSGRIIFSETPHESEWELNVDAIASGQYVLHIFGEVSETVVQFIKN